MALARTNLIGSISTGAWGTGAYTTASFTPPNNSLMVVVGCGMINGSPSADPSSTFTMSGGSWTYTSRINRGSNVAANEYDLGITIWTAPVTTGVSMTLSMDAGALNMQFLAIAAVAYTGYDTSTPTGATASLQQGDGTVNSGDGAQTSTLSGAPATTSEVVAGLAIDHEATGTTPGSTFTEIYEVQVGSSGGLQAQIRTGSTSTTVDWVDSNTGAGSAYKTAGAAVEIRVAGAAAPIPPILMMPARS